MSRYSQDNPAPILRILVNGNTTNRDRQDRSRIFQGAPGRCLEMMPVMPAAVSPATSLLSSVASGQFNIRAVLATKRSVVDSC